MAAVPYAKIAEVALTLLARASVPATDESLAYAQGARALLRGIANGTLTVTATDSMTSANKDKLVRSKPELFPAGKSLYPDLPPKSPLSG